MSAGDAERQLRVALIHPQYRPDGGAEQAISRTIEALGQQASLTVVTRRWNKHDAGVSPRVVECNPFYIGRLWREWGFAKAACLAVRQLDVDLVQSQVRVSCCDIYRAGGGVHREWLRQRDRIRPVWRRSLDRLSPYHRFKCRQERRFYNSTNLRAVICNSKMVAEELRRYFSLPDTLVHVIYNGVDGTRFRPDSADPRPLQIRRSLNIEERDIVFLFVGSGFERKGLAVAIEALATLPRDCHLLVVGKDKQANRYRQRARRLGLAGRVHFIGAKTDVLPYYRTADAFLLPTLYDPFANVCLEAFSCGLPVITSYKCGAVDLIRNGKNGYVCDALDRQALAAYMGELRSPDVRRKVGAAGRETVRPLSLEHMRERLLALYAQLLGAAVEG